MRLEPLLTAEETRRAEEAHPGHPESMGDLMERAGLRLPRFPEYAETMVKFFREHEDDPAFAPAL